MSSRIICLTVLTVVFVGLCLPQESRTSIERIIQQPVKFNDVGVTVTGLVTQYYPATSTSTSYYILKGAYGGLIKVNTSGAPPDINEFYDVTGIVYAEGFNNTALLSEKKRVRRGESNPIDFNPDLEKLVAIEDIIMHPDAYVTSTVTIKGLVTQYSPKTSRSTSHYILKGEYGANIRVNTLEGSPEINRSYIVQGIVYSDKLKPFVSETQKKLLLLTAPSQLKAEVMSSDQIDLSWVDNSDVEKAFEVYGSTDNQVFELLASVPANTTGYSRRDLPRSTLHYFKIRAVRDDEASNFSSVISATTNFFPSFSWTEIFLGGIALLTAVLSYSIVSRKRINPSSPSPHVPPISRPPSSPQQFETVKLKPSPPRTVTMMPGELVIVSGEDRGKAFKVTGFPTDEGSVATIGRDVPTGDRAYAHIRLDDRFRTISRRQAEIIYSDGKVRVRNLSETNPTHVDGVALKVGETRDLKAGSILRTGELEFEYRV